MKKSLILSIGYIIFITGTINARSTVMITTAVKEPFYFGITAGPCANHEGVMLPISGWQDRENQEKSKGVPTYRGTSDPIHINDCTGHLSFNYPDNSGETIYISTGTEYQVTVKKDTKNGKYYYVITHQGTDWG